MMEMLEGSTLDLIHRRRVTAFYPGYAIILFVVGIVVALPLVRVDVVSTSTGMIRPCQEPAELFSVLPGVVDSAVLYDHREVSVGDTLVWLHSRLPEIRMRELEEQIIRNSLFIQDIRSIIQGKSALKTSRFKQSFRMFSSSGSQLTLQKNYLQEEFETAALLFDLKVIPERDFEQTRNKYLVACAQLEDHQERYLKQLEDEKHHLGKEILRDEAELVELRTSLNNYFILAPSSGTLCQCKSLMSGSVIQAGLKLGTITSSQTLAADCYVETRDIKEIRPGSVVRIRMDGKSQGLMEYLETQVNKIDPDAMLINGRPVYRVRCLLVDSKGLVPGMTFSASILLYRTSLSSLLLDKFNRQLNPSMAISQKMEY